MCYVCIFYILFFGIINNFILSIFFYSIWFRYFLKNVKDILKIMINILRNEKLGWYWIIKINEKEFLEIKYKIVLINNVLKRIER